MYNLFPVVMIYVTVIIIKGSFTSKNGDSRFEIMPMKSFTNEDYLNDTFKYIYTAYSYCSNI